MFLAKYPESARMYSKMLRLSQYANTEKESAVSAPVLDLWKGQCNDAYWHGVFGGLYTPILRKITYENLIRSQVGLENRNFQSLQNWLSVNEDNGAGDRQIHLDSRYLGVTISPSNGGAISELDFKPRFVNIFDTLTRRLERYHSDIKKRANQTIVPFQKKKRPVSIHESASAKRKELEDLLVYDRYQKMSFVDYFVSSDSQIDSFVNQDFSELAQLPALPYEAEIQKSNLIAGLNLSCNSNAVNGVKFKMAKSIELPADRPILHVNYSMELSECKGDSALFVPEINLGSLSDETVVTRFKKSQSVKSDQFELSYADTGISVSVHCEDAETLWIIPIRTVSLSETGFESNLQSISILPVYPIDTAPEREAFNTSIELRVQSN